jgi:glycosyltransferase involved in cell wall biosynthesis
MPRGSGAIVVHRALEQHLADYCVRDYSPWWTLCPPALYPLMRGRTDLVHTAPDYAIFSSPPRVPLVVTFHGYMLDAFMRAHCSRLQWLHYRTGLRLYTKLALRRASAVTAVSRFIADLVVRDLGFTGHVRVIPNGIDTRVFLPRRTAIARPQVRVLFAGNLSRNKGASRLPKIAEQLPDRVEIWCATGLRGRRSPAAEKNLRVLGPIPHAAMPALYNEVDMLLLPAAREGFSLVVAEAMACGLPIVTSNTSAMPELVHDGRGGFLCPLDDPSAFATAIARLAADPALRRAMGEYNRARIENEYSLERMVQAYRELFEMALDDDRTLAN